jgi:hypothetical protein
MQGAGVYLEKFAKPDNYIKQVCALLNLEDHEGLNLNEVDEHR